MPSQKISSMPNATAYDSADVVPCVQAGVNNKVNRAVFLSCDTGDQIFLNKGTGGKVGIRNGASSVKIEIDGTDNIIISNSVGGISIGYTPTVAGDWAGAAPTTIEEALDRCAALLKVLNGGVGP